MLFLRSAAILAYLAIAQKTAIAAVFFQESTCQDVVLSGGNVETVCASVQGYTPSPALIDGETIYLGNYGIIFDYEGNYEGMELHIEWGNEESVSLCTANVNGQECTSCQRCNPTDPSAWSIRFDCQNLPDGRVTDCQSLDEGTILFPLDPYQIAAPSTTMGGRSQGPGTLNGLGGKSPDPPHLEQDEEKEIVEQEIVIPCSRLGCRGNNSP